MDVGFKKPLFVLVYQIEGEALGRSNLVYYLKQEVKGRYIVELSIHLVDDKRYLDGVKYSLIFIEPRSRKKVLMDNHHPKGPHFHLDDEEFDYTYVNDDRLLKDFIQLVLQHFGVRI